MIYFLNIYIPKVSVFSQNDDDYIIERKNDILLSATDFLFKDKNKKFVSVTLAFQIYNYVVFKYKLLLEKNE